MRFEEYRRCDAVALADLIAKRELSAGDVLDAAIARAEAVNPKINAVVHKQYERARRAIDNGLPAGPLAGVPFLLKDLAAFDAGEPSRFGSSLFADFVADHDSAYTARLTTNPTPPTSPKRTSCSQLAGLRMPCRRRTCGRISTAVASSRIREA